MADWVEDVEAGEGRELYPPREKLDYSDFREEIIRDDRPNRPHSRDSTLSKESRGSKEGKGKFLFFSEMNYLSQFSGQKCNSLRPHELKSCINDIALPFKNELPPTY